MKAVRCFYCLRRLGPRITTLDHVIPLAQGGDHSYRNVVACCFECNEAKWEVAAEYFLQLLYRKGRLNQRELTGRQSALKALQKGEARPNLHRRERLKRVWGPELVGRRGKKNWRQASG